MPKKSSSKTDTETKAPDFSALTPDAVINAVEGALGVVCSNICRPLASYINRVYEVGLDDGGRLVAKFYRPGRWSREALQDEIDFLGELNEAEVPVVPPRAGADGALLHELAGTFFAVFPKKGGRPLDEPSPSEWKQLGRLIGRMHVVGSQRAPHDRILLHPEHSTRGHLQYILESETVPTAYLQKYEEAATELIDLITPLFEGLPTLRLHADCHRGNILHRPGEGFHLLDFDDMAVGPAIQDLWLILPDRLPNARRELDLLLDGYETFLTFDYSTLRLIEPLRAMRYIHYAAWCARQKADGRFARLTQDWGTPGFWRQEITELESQRKEILGALDAG